MTIEDPQCLFINLKDYPCFGGFQCLHVDGSPAICDFGALAAEDMCISFYYSAISNKSWLILLMDVLAVPLRLAVFSILCF